MLKSVFVENRKWKKIFCLLKIEGCDVGILLIKNENFFESELAEIFVLIKAKLSILVNIYELINLFYFLFLASRRKIK